MSSESYWRSQRRIASEDDLHEALQRFNRDPFTDLLTEMIAAIPTPERLKAWAKERPGDWINSIKVLALLSGFTEKTESTQVHKHLHLHKLSDAELITETQKMIDNDPSLYGDLRSIGRAQPMVEAQKSQEEHDPLADVFMDKKELGD